MVKSWTLGAHIIRYYNSLRGTAGEKIVHREDKYIRCLRWEKKRMELVDAGPDKNTQLKGLKKQTCFASNSYAPYAPYVAPWVFKPGELLLGLTMVAESLTVLVSVGGDAEDARYMMMMTLRR